MVSETVAVADTLLASVTLTVKLDVPAAVGVPESTPVEALSVIPAGSVPLLTDQVYGAVPPLTVSVNEYAAPTSPDGGAVGPGAGDVVTARVIEVVAMPPFASITLTVNVEL